MTWEQKLHALNGLAGLATIVMREPGNWLVSHQLDIKEGSLLRGGAGNGPTLEAAVLDQWERLTTKLKPEEFIVVGGYGRPQGLAPRRVRWNGYMWADMPPPETAS